MRSEDVLAATGMGIWRWDHASRSVILDAKAAELLGLPPRVTSVVESTLRSCFHVVDFVELSGLITHALAEDRIAEARARVVNSSGAVQRTVRIRIRPYGTAQSTRLAPDSFSLVGTVSEVPDPTRQESQVTGDWRRAREAFLLDAGRALAEARSTDEVLRVASALSMPGFNPDGLAVFGVDGDRLTLIGTRGYERGEPKPGDMPLETAHPGADVVRSGRAIYMTSPSEYQHRYPTTWPLAAPLRRQSWAFLPLVVAGRTTGAWMAAFDRPVAFTPDERAVLATVARMLAQALSRAYLHESGRDLSEGLERTMRPVLSPDIRGMSVVSRYIPTGGGLQFGGDWYDLIPLPSGRTAVVIGDVQGHDVRAAGVMSQLRIALRAYAAEGHRPDAVLSRASHFLAGLAASSATDPDAEQGDMRFATCLYIEMDPLLGTLDVARAGHLDPAVRLPDGTLLVRPTAGGLPLGVSPHLGNGTTSEGDYPTTRLILAPGETLVVCTNGLVETGGHDVETGWDRLREVFEEFATPGDLDMEELADALVQAVHGPSSHHRRGSLSDRREDDIALLLARRDDGLEVEVSTRRMVLTLSQADASRVAEARHQLQEMLYDWGKTPPSALGEGALVPGVADAMESVDNTAASHAVDGAVLMLSEMLTNVLVHTDGDALMVAELTGEPGTRVLRVEVSDKSNEQPHRRDPGELASSGRGLVLMEMLADTWGVDPRGEGKVIWFKMREDAPPPTWD